VRETEDLLKIKMINKKASVIESAKKAGAQTNFHASWHPCHFYFFI